MFTALAFWGIRQRWVMWARDWLVLGRCGRLPTHAKVALITVFRVVNLDCITTDQPVEEAQRFFVSGLTREATSLIKTIVLRPS
jgi:hypothetical protein